MIKISNVSPMSPTLSVTLYLNWSGFVYHHTCTHQSNHECIVALALQILRGNLHCNCIIHTSSILFLCSKDRLDFSAPSTAACILCEITQRRPFWLTWTDSSAVISNACFSECVYVVWLSVDETNWKYKIAPTPVHRVLDGWLDECCYHRSGRVYKNRRPYVTRPVELSALSVCIRDSPRLDRNLIQCREQCKRYIKLSINCRQCDYS